MRFSLLSKISGLNFNGHSPQYYEIYKHGEVIGISMIFMLIDWSGGVFSIISLAFKETFDVIAGAAYGLIVVSTFNYDLFNVYSEAAATIQLLDGIILLAYLILNPIARWKRRREQQANLSVEATPNGPNPIINTEEEKGPETIDPPSRATVGDEEKARDDQADIQLEI